MRKGVPAALLAAALLAGGAAYALLAPKPPSDEDALGAFVELRLAGMEFGDTTAKARAARDAILERRGLNARDLAAWLEAWRDDPSKWDERQNRLIALIDSMRFEAGEKGKTPKTAEQPLREPPPKPKNGEDPGKLPIRRKGPAHRTGSAEAEAGK